MIENSTTERKCSGHTNFKAAGLKKIMSILNRKKNEAEKLLYNIQKRLYESPFGKPQDNLPSFSPFNKGFSPESPYFVLSDLFGDEKFINFIEIYEKATDLASAFLTPSGDIIAGEREICESCKSSRKNKVGEVYCLELTEAIARNRNSGKGMVYRCKQGYLTGVGKIFCDKKHIGSWVSGPVLEIDWGQDGEAIKSLPLEQISSSSKLKYKIAKKAIFERQTEALQGICNELSEFAESKKDLEKILHSKSDADEARSENEKRYRTLFESANDGIMILSGTDQKILHCNEKLLEIFRCSREDMIGRAPMEYSAKIQPGGIPLHEAGMQSCEIIHQNKSRTFEWTHVRADGSEFPAEVSVTQFELKSGKYFQSIIRDLTEKKRAEEEKRQLETYLRDTEKLRAIGTLAGGVAHDYNNLLMAIQANIYLALAKMEKEHAAYRWINNIKQYIEDGAKITSQILGYARGGKYSEEPIDVNDLIRETSEMFQSTRKDIVMHVDLDSQSSIITADKGQIEQVLLNLYLNSLQAMSSGGEIFIKTDRTKVQNDTKITVPAKPGKYVRISIRDTGHGMKPEIMERMYEPFFTTREVGQGHGLGLSSAYGIVKNHDGYIYAESEIGEGTTFYIILPTIEPAQKEKEIMAHDIQVGNEKIMLVDDEERIVDGIQELLKTLGYDVVVAYSGEEAIKTFKDFQEEVSIVILDLLMPGLSGEDTFIELRKLNPAIKILFASGYGADRMNNPQIIKESSGFLQKPFTRTELSLTLRQILE